MRSYGRTDLPLQIFFCHFGGLTVKMVVSIDMILKMCFSVLWLTFPLHQRVQLACKRCNVFFENLCHLPH
jgi:hypothetical protein